MQGHTTHPKKKEEKLLLFLFWSRFVVGFMSHKKKRPNCENLVWCCECQKKGNKFVKLKSFLFSKVFFVCSQSFFVCAVLQSDKTTKQTKSTIQVPPFYPNKISQKLVVLFSDFDFFLRILLSFLFFRLRKPIKNHNFFCNSTSRESNRISVFTVKAVLFSWLKAKKTQISKSEILC